MALATGADTHKMKYGHRGGNHPVKDLQTGRVYISSQNHGYVVDTDTLDPSVAVPAFVECKRRYKRRTVLHQEKHFHGTVPSGSVPGTTRIPVTCLTVL